MNRRDQQGRASSKASPPPPKASRPAPRASRQSAKASRSPAKTDELYVVGIGASAGGLEALRPFVANLPTSANLCFVVAQHLSPQHRSMMVELLSRETKIPVVGINNGVSIKANTVYIAPPNSDVFYRNGKLVLRTPLESIGPKPSIDHFFSSLASGLGPRAIAIVLSGTGSDGANGLREVKAHGGITFAQEPSSAKYESMPRAAMTIGGADLILPPKEIAGKLAAIAQGHNLHLGLAEKTDDAGGTFQTIMRHIRRQTGIDFSKYKEATLRRQVARRMSALQIGALKEYVGFIEHHRDEIDILAKNFLISVTAFFRDKESFTALGKLLDKIVKEKRSGDSLRIWVPGCATGEEAYSIALLLATKARTRLAGLRVQIFGTDIDGLATAHARRGEYAESSVINLKGNLVHNYFVNNGRLFRIDKTIRDMVVFSRHDVAQDPPFKNMDLISCRNLLIYFKPSLQEHIFKLFHYALRPGGYLFLGKSESLGGCKSLFSVLEARHKLFRRRDVATRPYYVPRAIGVPAEPDIEPPRKPAEALEQDAGRIGRDILIERYGPPSILVSHDGEPVHFFGDVSRFVRLGSSSGKVDLNLLTIVDSSLRAELRVLLHRAQRDHHSQYGQLHGGDKLGRALRLAVHPVDRTRAEERLFLVSFEERDATPAPFAISPDKLDDTAAQQISALEQELKAAKENLQTVVEELETSNEELQSTNEELQASNEELQASNEELETANEELQATNEELTTVNDELSVKTTDLAEANSELEGIMANSAEGIVLIDPTLRIQRSNEKATRILQLPAGPEHTHLVEVTAFDGASSSARSAVEKALKSGTAHAEEVQIHGRRYLMQVCAYRTEKRITGAILSLSDVTELRSAERAAAEQGQRARSLIENAADGIMIANSRGLIHICNPAACELLDVPATDMIGKRADQLFFNRDVNIRPLIEHLVADGKAATLRRFEITLVRRGRHRHFDVGLSDFTIEGETYRAATLREITELYDARESLAHAKKIAEQLNAAKTSFLTKMSHELRTPLNAIVGFSDAILNEIYGPLEHERYRSYVGDIHSSGVHLLGLINDVFDIAKIEAGMLRLNEEPVDLVKLVSSAVSFVGPLATKAGVIVVFDFKTPAVCLRVDELRIRQVLLNVLSNAIKFSHRGGKVRVTVRPLDGQAIAVEVTDHGIGMEKQALDRIGTEFVAPANIRGGDKEGSGLGLPVSIALMKAHGGALRIESAPGKGTTVTLCFTPDRVLPATKLNGGAGASPAPGAGEEKEAGRRSDAAAAREQQ